MHFFHKQKQKFEVRFFNLFFGCKLAFVLKYKFYDKKNFACKFDFLCLLVQDEFFNQKTQKLQERFFFCKHDYYLLFHLLKQKQICKKTGLFFLNHQNF